MITIAINTMERSAQTIVRNRMTGTMEDFHGVGFLVIAHALRETNTHANYRFSNSFNCTSCFADAEGLRMEMALCMGSMMASRIRGS